MEDYADDAAALLEAVMPQRRDPSDGREFDWLVTKPR